MNHIKNKLQNHEIKPSKMAWERIESELDKGKVRVLPFDIRWAAAAMFLVAATGVITYNTLQNTDNQSIVNVKNANEDKNINISKEETKQETIQNRVVKQEKKPFAKKPISSVIYKSEPQNIVQEVVQIPQILQIETPKRTPRILLENANTIAKVDCKLLDIKIKSIDIQRISEGDEDLEDDNVAFQNRNFPRILKQTEGDSTLTEKIISFGQMKAKQAVSKAFKPVLKRFNR